MKVYVIQEPGESLVRVLPRRDCAQAECDSLNAEGDSRYEVSEVEVESYASALVRAEAAIAKVAEATLAAFLAGCRELFEAHPGLQSFGWQQYTDYNFEEGLSSFHVVSYWPDINGIDGLEVHLGWVSDPQSGKWDGSREPSSEGKLQDPVKKFLDSFHEDDMEAMFGDYVRVTVHRDGTIDTEHYYED
jgi:hypothetical protein